MAAAVEVYLNN